MASLFGRITGPLVANRRLPRRHFKLNRLAFCEPLEQRVLLAADIEFAAATSLQLENGSGGTAPTFVVSGDNLNGTNDVQRTVNFAVTGGTASSAGVDFTSTGTFIVPEADYTSGPVTFDLTTFTNAENPTARVSITNDARVEGNENFVLGITGLGVALQTGDANGNSIVQTSTDHTIDDNDTALVEIVSAQTVAEEGGAQSVTVRLTTSDGAGGTATLGTGVTITADVVDAGGGLATSGVDYSAFGTQGISFTTGEGDGAIETVTLTTLTDSLVEGDETVNLMLQNLNEDRYGQVSLGGTEAVTIIDNEMTTVSITANDAAASEAERRCHPAGSHAAVP